MKITITDAQQRSITFDGDVDRSPGRLVVGIDHGAGPSRQVCTVGKVEAGRIVRFATFDEPPNRRPWKWLDKAARRRALIRLRRRIRIAKHGRR